MYKIDYGNQQNSSAAYQQVTVPQNSAQAGYFPVRGAQGQPQMNATYPANNGQPHPQYYPQATLPAAPMQPQQGYYPQAPPGYYPPGGYQPMQPGSQPQLHAAAGGWQPSVMSVPTYTQQVNVASAMTIGTSSKGANSTKCFRVQLMIIAALHAACAGTFLGMEIWAMYIKAWLSSAALGIWAGFGVFICCATISVVIVCRPKRQVLLNVGFGFSIAGTIVAIGLCAIAGVGISFENSVNYTLRDNYWPYRVPTHIVKMIFAGIAALVSIWELLIIRARFEAKAPSKKPRRAPVAVAYQAAPTVARSIGQPDALSGLSMQSSVQLVGPQAAEPPTRVFKALPDAPADVPQPEGQFYPDDLQPSEPDLHQAPERPPTRPSRRRDAEEPPIVPRTNEAQQNAPPPRPAKKRSTQPNAGYESRSEDERELDSAAPSRPPPRPGRSKRDKSPPPPPQDTNAFDDPFNAPITRPAQPGNTQKRYYQYADAPQ